MDTRIRAEWDTLRSVAMNKFGVEMFFRILQSDKSLNESTLSQIGAIQEYEYLEQVLEQEFKVNIIRVRDTILKAAQQDPTIYDELLRATQENTDASRNQRENNDGLQSFQKGKDAHNPSHLFDNLFMRYQIEMVNKKGPKPPQKDKIEKQSLSEIYFLRDQQAVTDRGFFLSRVSKPWHRKESVITKLLCDVLGIEVIHEVTEPGLFEGGDFIPLKDFALVGVGDRTNIAGIKQLLEYGVNFDEVAVVHQPNHPLIPTDEVGQMMNMRLDNYFNIASKGVAVGLKSLLKTAIVDIYNRVSPGEYEREEENIDLLSYMAGWGFDVVGITTLEQLSNASNFLTVKDGTILTVEIERNVKDILYQLQIKAKAEPEKYGKLLAEAEKDYEYLKNESEFFPHKRELYQHGIDAYPLVFRNLTGVYGAAHSMTAVLERR